MKEADQKQKVIQQTDQKLSSSSPNSSYSNSSVQTPFTLLSPAISTQPAPTIDIIQQNASLTGVRSSSTILLPKVDQIGVCSGPVPLFKKWLIF